MFRGAFSAALFYQVGAIIGIASLIVIYWQSQYYHHEPPFPHRTISQVAQHYPEFLSFRTGTITGSVFIVLGWLTNHFVLNTIALQHGINLGKYHPKIPLKAGVTGGCLLMMSTALIDTGHMFQLLHEICATSFFILSFFAQVYNSIIVFDLQSRTKAFSQANIYVKYFILGMLFLQLIYSFSSGYGLTGFVTVHDAKGNFLEWTLTATIISMFLSIGYDASQFQFEYSHN